MDSAVAFNPAGEWDRPALIGYLGTAPPYVKGMNPGRGQMFPPDRGHRVTFLPEYVGTLCVVKGVVTIRGEYGVMTRRRGTLLDLLSFHLTYKTTGDRGLVS